MNKKPYKYRKGYPGNKSLPNLLPHILGLIPIHSTYFELFAGSAQVLLAKAPAKHSAVVDIDDFQISQLSITTPPGTTVINSCAIKWLEDNASAAADVFVYADPPYIISTRLSQSSIYNHEMSDADHFRFLAAARAFKGKMIISHYKCAAYDSALPTWNCRTVKVSCSGIIATEALYYNFPENLMRAQPFKAGIDKTDRQRIKRKAERWFNNFCKLPVYEQQALLKRIKELHEVFGERAD